MNIYDKPLVTGSGAVVPPLPVSVSSFMDCTTAIYGPSKTGKTVIVKNIMQILNPHIEQIFIICPTEPTNKSYEGIVRAPYIHYTLNMPDPDSTKRSDPVKGAIRFLEALWKRQEMMAAIYVRANKLDVLARLYKKSGTKHGRDQIRRAKKCKVESVEKVKHSLRGQLGRLDEEVKKVVEKCDTLLIMLYKNYLVPEYQRLCKYKLDPEESFSLKYLLFNPKLLLIFDDCAAELKPLFNKDIFRKLFYQNRHSFISVIICCQDDTDLPANLRKNAFISFFTTPIVTSANFKRGTNQFDLPTKKYVDQISPDLFGNKYRKLAYIREDETHFYHIQFPYPSPFTFGSDASDALCDEIEEDGNTMDDENPYYRHFKLSK
jgi:hypothetical protein